MQNALPSRCLSLRSRKVKHMGTETVAPNPLPQREAPRSASAGGASRGCKPRAPFCALWGRTSPQPSPGAAGTTSLLTQAALPWEFRSFKALGPVCILLQVFPGKGRWGAHTHTRTRAHGHAQRHVHVSAHMDTCTDLGTRGRAHTISGGCAGRRKSNPCSKQAFTARRSEHRTQSK